MSSKLVFVLLFLFLVPITCIRLDRVSAAPSEDPHVHNLSTNLDYYTINDAISANETSNGDTIRVDAGSYLESVSVTKSVSIIGEGMENTVIRSWDADPEGVVFAVGANNVTISGFTIRDAYWGIDTRADYLTVANCTIANNAEGIRTMYYFGGHTITNNRIENNRMWGVVMYTNNNTISDNIITGSSWGISLNFGLPNRTSGSIVINNTLMNNNVGCEVRKSDNNTIFLNSFLHNNRNAAAYDGSVNKWDNGTFGNYWSNYTGSDVNNDGIGYTPYTIDQDNVDHFPLTSPHSYWISPISGDINYDMKVDMQDIAFAAVRLGSRQGDSKWETRADVTGDGVIDIRDVVAIAKNFGKHLDLYLTDGS